MDESAAADAAAAWSSCPRTPRAASEAVETMAALLARPSHLPIVLAGPDADTLIATALGGRWSPCTCATSRERDVMAEAALISALEDRPLIFEGLEDIEPGERGRLLRAIEPRHERTILAAPTRTAALALGERTVLLVEAAPPSFAERRQAWADLSGAPDTGDVAAKFRLSMTQIVEAAEVARLSATARGCRAPEPSDLDAGARQASSSRLGELAARLPPGYKWEDLVVPPKQAEQLQSISAYLRHRDRVLSDWGYEKTVSRTQGLKVLFAGESGTGKTMGAQVIAAELGLEIFRVDLATTVSKYIGETEKNLDRIFGAAEGSNAILFFDEADALFGKRSEVGDSHDRYANIEVAYLLQKMEGYPGAVILATNFRRNIDDAFVRRLDFVIDFPFPEKEDRMPDLGQGAAARGAARRRHRPRLPGARSSSSPAARSATARCPPPSRPPTTTRPIAMRHLVARGRERVRQAGPADAGGRLRTLPRGHPRRRARSGPGN